jgi:ribosomal protein S27AE
LRLREEVFFGGFKEIEEEASKVMKSCGRCGPPLVRNGYDPEKIITLIGKVKINRIRLRCKNCGEDIYPLDEAIEVLQMEKE